MHDSQPPPLHVLLVEDDPGDAGLAQIALRASPNARFAVVWARSLAEARELLAKQAYAVVLLDLGLPDSPEVETLAQLRALPGVPPIIVLTGLSDADFGLNTLKSGAADYLVKGDFGYDGLARTILYTLHRTEMERELLAHRHHLEQLVTERTADLSIAKEAAEAASRAKSTFLRQHEPRTAHADERHHGHDRPRPAPGHRSETDRSARQDRPGLPTSAARHQRHSRHLQDRGRTTDAGTRPTSGSARCWKTS